MKRFEVLTVNEDGQLIFHDRTVDTDKIIKVLNLEGFCVYLNPRDNMIIHRLAKDGRKYRQGPTDSQVIREEEVTAFQHYMDMVVASYRQTTTNSKEEHKEAGKLRAM